MKVGLNKGTRLTRAQYSLRQIWRPWEGVWTKFDTILRPKDNIGKILYKLHDKLYGSDAEILIAVLVDFLSLGSQLSSNEFYINMC